MKKKTSRNIRVNKQLTLHPLFSAFTCKVGQGIEGKNSMPKGIYIRTEEHRSKMSKAQKKRASEGRNNLKEVERVFYGDENLAWKGNNVGNGALHSWVSRSKGKAKKCSHCGKEGSGKEMHWANKDHSYRRNLDDFIELCSSCHQKYDRANNNWRK